MWVRWKSHCVVLTVCLIYSDTADKLLAVSVKDCLHWVHWSGMIQTDVGSTIPCNGVQTNRNVHLCLLPNSHVTSHATLSASWLPYHDGVSLTMTAWDWTGHAGVLPPSLLPMAGLACLSWRGQSWKGGVLPTGWAPCVIASKGPTGKWLCVDEF